MKSKRRALLAAGLALGLAPSRAAAQPGSGLRLIGGLSGSTRAVPWESSNLHGFAEGLRELGYVEGKDFVMEWRFAEGNYERFAGFVQEYLGMKVDLIFAVNTRGAIEAQRATRTVPIVFASLSDPVGSGLIASLARPGANATGVAEAHDLIIAKHFELSTIAVPSLTRVAALINPNNPFYPPMVKTIEAAAQKAQVSLSIFTAGRLDELEPAFAAMKRERAEALIVLDDSLYNSNRARLAALASHYQLPAIAGNTEYASAGLLMSYGEPLRDQLRRAATYADKIFRGAKPADLPVEQPTRYYLTVNLKTARAIGLTVPQGLLLRADRLIQE